MDYDRLLNLTTDLGYQLMASGAEIYRVEESMHRVLNAYGLERPEVFAIPNCIIVSVTTPQGHPITRMRRIPGHGTDIELLERCNDLCRHLCSQVPPLEDAQSLVSALERGYPRYSSHQVLMGYGLAPAFFTLLFGGHFLDGLCAFVCGLAVGICLLYGGRFIGSNSFFRTVVCSTVGSLLSLLLVRLGFGYDVDTVTIGVLMVLVPGVALTNEHLRVYNGRMQKAAEEKQVVFLDLYSEFANENGELPEEASKDGVHLKSDYCKQWLEYLKVHTVDFETLYPEGTET